MILIYDISDRDKNPFLVTWVNRAGDPLGRDPSQPPPPPPIVHDRKQNCSRKRQ
jgi:hypothetical protein